MMTNMAVASFNDSANFGPASSTITESNGRVFLLGGDALLEITQFSCNNVDMAATMLWAVTAGVQASLRIRSPVLNGVPMQDIHQLPGW